jgi:hypothetical protein
MMFALWAARIVLVLLSLVRLIRFAVVFGLAACTSDAIL